MKSPYNFKTAFCTRFDHRQEHFEKRVFWDALNPEARVVAFFISCLRPDFFRSDLDCIRSIGEAETPQEVRTIVNSFHFDPDFKRGFFRGFLRVRISGRRLTRIASKVLMNERQG